MQEESLHATTFSQKMEAMVLERSRPAFSSLEMLWDEMGLGQEELDQRFETVSARISNVTAEMVECDTKNRDKIKKKCVVQRERIKELAVKLRLAKSPEEVSEDLSLVEQNRQLALVLKTLEDKMEAILGNFRSLVDKEVRLAAKLGISVGKKDARLVPDVEMIGRLEKNIEELKQEVEEREMKMFSMKEDIVSLLEALEMDMNATNLDEMLMDDQEHVSLKKQDLKKVEATLVDLRKKVKFKEAETLVQKVAKLYERLRVPQEERSALASGRVCGLEELAREDNMVEVREELERLLGRKEAMMSEILENARQDLEKVWQLRRVGARTRAVFLASSLEDQDEELLRIEEETGNVEEDLSANKELLKKLATFLQRCSLAEDLQLRLQDPERLFKSRGKAMVQEEQDRKKVNALPTLRKELLGLVELRGDIEVDDSSISSIIEEKSRLLEQIYESSLSSTVPTAKATNGASSSRGSSTTIATTNRRPLVRANSDLGTKSLAGSRAPVSCKTVASTRSRARDQGSRARLQDQSPLGRPERTLGARGRCRDPTPKLQVQEASLLSETAFGERVPLSSTILATSMNVLDVTAAPTTATNDVTAAQMKLQQSLAELRTAQKKAVVTKIKENRGEAADQPMELLAPTNVRAAKRAPRRRSNSCSDLTLRNTRTRLWTTVTPGESSRKTPGSSSKEVAGSRAVPGSNPRLVRTASSANLFVR